MIMKNGTATTAPFYFHNATGATSWSEKAEGDLSAIDLLDILAFCEEEAWRQGHNDEKSGHAYTMNKQPYFHPEFLRGLPHAWWNEHYENGRSDRQMDQQSEAEAARGAGSDQ